MQVPSSIVASRICLLISGGQFGLIGFAISPEVLLLAAAILIVGVEIFPRAWAHWNFDCDTSGKTAVLLSGGNRN